MRNPDAGRSSTTRQQHLHDQQRMLFDRPGPTLPSGRKTKRLRECLERREGSTWKTSLGMLRDAPKSSPKPSSTSANTTSATMRSGDGSEVRIGVRSVTSDCRRTFSNVDSADYRRATGVDGIGCEWVPSKRSHGTQPVRTCVRAQANRGLHRVEDPLCLVVLSKKTEWCMCPAGCHVMRCAKARKVFTSPTLSDCPSYGLSRWHGLG